MFPHSATDSWWIWNFNWKKILNSVDLFSIFINVVLSKILKDQQAFISKSKTKSIIKMYKYLSQKWNNNYLNYS